MCVNPARVICEACSRTSTAGRACTAGHRFAQTVASVASRESATAPYSARARPRARPWRPVPAEDRPTPRRGFPYRAAATNKPSRSSWPAWPRPIARGYGPLCVPPVYRGGRRQGLAEASGRPVKPRDASSGRVLMAIAGRCKSRNNSIICRTGRRGDVSIAPEACIFVSFTRLSNNAL